MFYNKDILGLDQDAYYWSSSTDSSGAVITMDASTGRFKSTAGFSNASLRPIHYFASQKDIELFKQQLEVKPPTPTPTPTPTPKIANPVSSVKIITFRCYKGKTIKIIKGVKPKCPTGYKLKS